MDGSNKRLTFIQEICVCVPCEAKSQPLLVLSNGRVVFTLHHIHKLMGRIGVCAAHNLKV